MRSGRCGCWRRSASSGWRRQTRFYQASTSELYGLVQETPQRETTPFHPRSPYAVAKLYAYWITVNYREAYGIYACNGILFNHESPRRGETFVTRKITRGLANIAQGLEACLYMGNIDSLRDWGHAKDYVRMQWMMLQQDEPEDFVIATGEQYSVREFITWAAEDLGIDTALRGHGRRRGRRRRARRGGPRARRSSPADVIVRIDPRYFRPAEVETLLGDPSKAREKLGWEPADHRARDVRGDGGGRPRDRRGAHALLKEHGLRAADRRSRAEARSVAMRGLRRRPPGHGRERHPAPLQARGVDGHHPHPCRARPHATRRPCGPSWRPSVRTR